ncbi:hypothetical protein QQM79_08145 [Marinobacteraceae bacterium S3BR75-40.1]
MKKTDWPIRWDLLLRYRLIEIIALWEGRLTTNHICHSFGIGRQQASKDINNYLREIGPGNLAYDRHIKGYVPTEKFTPKVTLGTPQEYLSLLDRNAALKKTFENLAVGLPNTEVVSLNGSGGRPEFLRPVMLGARQNRRVEVGTVSLENPEPQQDLIEPHTLVCLGSQWLARAWSENEQRYRDYRISRLRGCPRVLPQKSRHRVGEDEAWHTEVGIDLCPASHLSPQQQAIVAEDYGMAEGFKRIETRGPLVPYVLEELALSGTLADAGLLEVANVAELAAWRNQNAA